MTETMQYEVELLLDPRVADRGVPVFHVKLESGLDVFLFRSADHGAWIATAPLRGFHGCRVPARWHRDMPSLPAIVAAAFPELCLAGSA